MTGTPTIDLIIPGVGRIHRHIGSEDPKVVKAVRAAVYLCLEQGRLSVLEGLRDGTLTPKQLYDAYRTNRLNRLANAGALVPLLPKLEEFQEVYPKSEGYRKDIKLMRRQVEAVARKHATLSDLPSLLLRLKARYERLGAPVTYNRHRRVAMAFARWATGQKRPPLWHELSDTLTMPYARPEKPGLTVEEFRAGVAKLPSPHAAMCWSLVLSGMNWKEYAVDGWETAPEAGVVRIHGAKREARDRIIPYLAPLSEPDRDYRAFRKQVHLAFGLGVTPHTFRRTYIQWAEAAGISRFRVKTYCGHATATDVTDLYENEKVGLAVLQADRRQLIAHIGRPLGVVSLTLEKTA